MCLPLCGLMCQWPCCRRCDACPRRIPSLFRCNLEPIPQSSLHCSLSCLCRDDEAARHTSSSNARAEIPGLGVGNSVLQETSSLWRCLRGYTRQCWTSIAVIFCFCLPHRGCGCALHLGVWLCAAGRLQRVLFRRNTVAKGVSVRRRPLHDMVRVCSYPPQTPPESDKSGRPVFQRSICLFSPLSNLSAPGVVSICRQCGVTMTRSTLNGWRMLSSSLLRSARSSDLVPMANR